MSAARKLRAIFALALTSAFFWGTAVAIGSLGYALLEWGFRRGIAETVVRMFLLGAGIGFVGGAVYAAAMALVPHRADSGGLSTSRAALYGFLGGAVVYGALQLLVPMLMGTGSVTSILATCGVMGLLGSATGVAILGTARRAALRRGDPEPPSLAP